MSAADVIDPGTSTGDYSQHFWGDKHNGYQVMYDNLKRGEDAISEVATFIKERLSAEEEYAKLVGKGTNKVSAFLSNGTCLENGWALTKGTFEIISDVQTMMVKNLQDLSREILKYKDEVAKVRKDAKQQEVIEAVNLMQTTTTCLQKAKETYQSRWVEFVKIRKDTSEKNQKEVTKAEAKLNKAREEYKSYVEKYEVVRVVYEEKMEAMCRFFQNHDRAHYANLHQFLMVYASHHQESAHSIQQLCGQLRESLQQQSVDDQLAHFVKEKGTGMDRPQAAVFEDIEAAENELLPIREDRPSLLQTSMSHPPSSAGNDLLGLDILDSWGGAAGTVQERKQSVTVQPSPTASQSSDSTAGPISTSVFGSSMGAGTKKLSMFMPKRKKTISQSSIGDEEGGNLSGGLFKFRQNRRSKKSTSDLTATNSINSERPFDGHSMDDARSTTSSSRSEEKDKHLNGSLHILDQPNGRPTDEEGFSIPTHHEAEKEDTNWSSCSSDEEDEIEMQQSRIRSISIKPAESAVAINASVDELRDAIGSITIGSLGRSNTFDKDPWSVAGSKPPLFSQSMTAGSLKPLRPAHTADGRFRTNFAESEFSKSNVPLNFSASCGPMAGMARARPRSNTPTHNSTFGLSVGTSTGTSGTLTKEGTNNSQEWGSSFGMNRSDSHNSLGGSSFNLSQSTANLMQATISEQRVPLAMALNEYSHVWFNGSEVTNRTIRTFGTVMISFANSSVPLLTALNSEIELLTFQLTNTEMIKTIVPNKQLLLPPSSSPAEGVVTFYSFDRLGLANWLLAQQKERPTAAFFNAEVLRYELKEEGPNREPPLLIKSYWKCEEDHTDLRVDYHLNSEGPIGNALLNLVFSAKVAGDVGQIISEPSANWSAETGTISWIVTELSKHGDSSGSLKARVKLNSGGPSPSAHTYAQFQSSDTTISGMGISLPPSDIFHLSMIKRKVQAGKYFCEPEIRK